MLFHSVLGLREAEREIAAFLAQGGHDVTLPDLYRGQRTDDYDEGFRLQQAIGQERIEARAREALAAAPADTVLAGVSSGAFLVGRLWAARPAMPGALLLAGIAPWMSPQTAGLPVAAHIARPDAFDDEATFEDWGAAARGVALELFRYDGAGHYFLDRRLPDYDEAAAALCLRRSLAFLDRIAS